MEGLSAAQAVGRHRNTVCADIYGHSMGGLAYPHVDDKKLARIWRNGGVSGLDGFNLVGVG